MKMFFYSGSDVLMRDEIAPICARRAPARRDRAALAFIPSIMLVVSSVIASAGMCVAPGAVAERPGWHSAHLDDWDGAMSYLAEIGVDADKVLAAATANISAWRGLSPDKRDRAFEILDAKDTVPT